MQKARRHPKKGAPTACRHMVSGTISLPYSGCFSPFLHSTCSLSVSQEYLAFPDGPGEFTQNSSCSALLRIPLASHETSHTGLSPSTAELSRFIPLISYNTQRGPITPELPKQSWFGLFPGRSPLLGGSLFIFSSSRY